MQMLIPNVYGFFLTISTGSLLNRSSKCSTALVESLMVWMNITSRDIHKNHGLFKTIRTVLLALIVDIIAGVLAPSEIK